MKRIFVVICVVFAMAGCAVNKMWVRDGATGADFERTQRECRYEADKHSYVPIPRGGIGAAMVAGIEQGIRYSNLYNQCMEIHGFRLVDKPK